MSTTKTRRNLNPSNLQDPVQQVNVSNPTSQDLLNWAMLGAADATANIKELEQKLAEWKEYRKEHFEKLLDHYAVQVGSPARLELPLDDGTVFTYTLSQYDRTSWQMSEAAKDPDTDTLACVEYLAKRGYRTVTPVVNREYSFKELKAPKKRPVGPARGA